MRQTFGHNLCFYCCPRAVYFMPGGCEPMSESDVIANQKKILRNQKEIIANQNQIKSNQNTIKKNQATILKNQGSFDTVLQNQKQILALLNK
jgi:esterase/lipase